jgi:hypothetical protein
MWMDFACETSLVAERPETRQHLFTEVIAPGFTGCRKFWQAFFEFFAEQRHEFETRLPPGSRAASRRGFAFCVANPIGSAHESTRIGSVQSLVAIGVISVSGFRNGNNAVTISLTQKPIPAGC